MLKLEDILTLIKAVSESELTEVKIEIEDEKEDLTFTASKNKKEDATVQTLVSAQAAPPCEAGMPPQMFPPQVTFPSGAGIPSTAGMPPAMGMPPQMGFQPQAGVPFTTLSTQPVFQQPVVPVGAEYITSPMVGTFYAAPAEDAEPFVAVGDTVKKGQVIGIVEAMKLMNEVESPYDGVVEKILVENKTMVGFGDELMLIRTGQNGQ